MVRQKNLLITLSFDDHIKIWNFEKGTLLNCIYQENIAAASKLVATENLLFWSSWGKVVLYDLAEIANRKRDSQIKQLRVDGPVYDFELINNTLFLASADLLKSVYKTSTDK